VLPARDRFPSSAASLVSMSNRGAIAGSPFALALGLVTRLTGAAQDASFAAFYPSPRGARLCSSFALRQQHRSAQRAFG